MVLFSDSFLELKSRFTKSHRIILIILAGWGVLTFLSFFLDYHSIVIPMMVWALASLITSFIAGILTWRKGYNPARFLMIAWFGMLAYFILLFFVRLGIVPSTFLTENLYLVGMIWMAVCWSIALSDRINLLKTETESAIRELSKSEHRLSRILDGLPLGVLLYGTDQKAKYANQRVYDIFNDPAQNVMVDPAGRRTVEEAISYYSLKVAGTSQKYPIENFPIPIALQGEQKSADDIEIDRGNVRVALEVQASPVRDDAGNVESAVVAIRDITERKRVEAELDEYRKQLEILVEKRTAELSSINNELTFEAAERKNLELALQQRIEWLSLVSNVRQTIIGATSIQGAYEDLSNKILELFNAKLVFIVRWDNQSSPSECFCFPSESDISPDSQDLKAAFQVNTILRREIELGNNITWFSDQTELLPEPLARYFQEHDDHSAILVPIKGQQSVVGVLSVIGFNLSQGILTYQVDLIERMAFDLVDLVQDADLMDQNKALITAEERNRLARELHDSVTQTLFSASILAEATPRIWDKDQDIARQNMDKLSVLIRGALAEMRSMLIELRSEDLHRQSLGQLLTMLVEAARARTNTGIIISRLDNVELPNDVAMAFYRIAREAINNIIVHADASQINIDLIAEQGHVELNIEDNGCGFDPQVVSEGHLGIRIMSERAAMIGGNLQINSQPGEGTKITVTWSDQVGGIA
jgi:signal transduction histidine kinase